MLGCFWFVGDLVCLVGTLLLTGLRFILVVGLALLLLILWLFCHNCLLAVWIAVFVLVGFAFGFCVNSRVLILFYC